MQYMTSIIHDDPGQSCFIYGDMRWASLRDFERSIHDPQVQACYLYHYPEGASPRVFLTYDRDA